MINHRVSKKNIYRSLLKSMSIVTKVSGFRNLGNTCYMNSTIQALLSSNVLNTVLLMYIQKNPTCLTTFSPMLIDYCRIIIDLLSTQSLPYSPIPFKLTLDHENNFFQGSDQHDSNELLQYMINEFADEKKDKGIAKLIKKVCFGKYKQYICCAECMNVVVSYFNFLDVILPIPITNNPDLNDCFQKFAMYDTLDNTNKWACPTCKKKVIIHKKMEIHEVPDIAIFTLNRFNGTTKNNTPVKIYQRIELEEKKLKLVATVNHYGETGGGHYIAHISRNDKWYIANDASIHESSIDAILNDRSVYMMVYQIDY